MSEMKPDGGGSSSGRNWLGLLGIVVGTAIGMIVVTLIRDGEVDWARLLPLVAGAVVGGAIVNFMVNR